MSVSSGGLGLTREMRALFHAPVFLYGLSGLGASKPSCSDEPAHIRGWHGPDPGRAGEQPIRATRLIVDGAPHVNWIGDESVLPIIGAAAPPFRWVCGRDHEQRRALENAHGRIGKKASAVFCSTQSAFQQCRHGPESLLIRCLSDVSS